MNDQQFLERAHANPHDGSPDFQEAIAGNPTRQTLVEELKAFDARLKTHLESVSAPDGLQQALLDLPEATPEPEAGSPDHAGAGAAANDSHWRRNVQYAAGLIVAIGVLVLVVHTRGNPMEDMIFKHIYSELSFLEDDSPMGLSQVNQVMFDTLGSSFAESGDMETVSFNFSKDCWVDFDNGIRGVHMVMQGNIGPVTVMVIPNSPVAQETAINDDHFYGIITPGSGGNIVVVGEKEEPLQQYSSLLASNLSW